MNSKGFSLIEMTVVLALMGIASLGVLQINSSTHKATKTSEIGLEVNSITNSITQNLLNSSACSNTFKNSGIIQNGLEISEIKNRTDQVLFNKTTKYGNNRLKISKLKLDSVNIKPADPGLSKKYGEFRLIIELEKLGTGYAGTKNVIKNIPLQGEFNLSDNLLKCYSSTEDAVYTAKKESCDDVGGTWNIAADTCSLSTSTGKNIAASTQDLSDKIQDLKDNYLTNNYVAKVGDTMTGDLTISGKDLTAKNVNSTVDLKAANKVCVGNNCWDLAAKNCNKDSVLIGIKADGTPNCLALKCNDGFYLEKLDTTSGNIVCKAIPTGTCPANTYVSKVKTDGTVECSPLPAGTNQTCATGKHMTGIKEDGTIICSSYPAANVACGGSTFVNRYDGNGVPSCGLPAPPPPPARSAAQIHCEDSLRGTYFSSGNGSCTYSGDCRTTYGGTGYGTYTCNYSSSSSTTCSIPTLTSSCRSTGGEGGSSGGDGGGGINEM
jgi:prepilin-type N-terminal cleavage/methylation domain-containing protein